jgi:pimeloyl-ACP methyl ester carboxylesterase
MRLAYRDETKELTEFARQGVGGSFVKLSDGLTHYERSNPEAKETIVLIHGFSVPYFIYDPTFEFLTRAGFGVLRYDLFGRGFSDRPDTCYDIDLFVRQLGDLVEALGIPQPASLVGLSMGGPIAAAFTVAFPAKVNKLVLIGPVGAMPFALGQALRCLEIPVLGEALVGVIGSVRVARLIAAGPFDPERVGEFGPRYIVPMEYKGFKRAVLSTVRNHMLGSFLDIYRQIGRIGKPVLLFWGRNDTTVPCSHSDILRAAIPTAELHVIEGSGHIPHHEKPEAVNPVLLEFLSR